MLQGDSLFCSTCKDTTWTPLLTIPSLQRLSITGDSIYILKNDTFFVANINGSTLSPVSPKLPFPINKYAIVDQSIYVVNKSWTDTSGTKHQENLHRFRKGDTGWVQLTERIWPDNITAMAAAGGRIFTGNMKGLSVWSEADSTLLPLSNSVWVDMLFSAFGKLLVAPRDPITLNKTAIESAGIPADLIVPNILNNETFLTAAGDSTLYILNETENVGLHEAYSFHYDGSSFSSKKGLFGNEVMGLSTSVDRLLFDGQTLWAYSKTKGFYKSDDIGKSWGIVSSSTMGGNLRSFTKLGTSLCAVNANSVYVSSNGGSSWTVVDFGSDTGRIFLDAFISGSDAFITSSNGFFRTRDAGKTWTSINQNAQVTGSCALHGKSIMFFTNDSTCQIVHSADDGATWKTSYQADSSAERFQNISASDAGALVYSSTRGILYSGDGGATWNTRNKGITDSLHINGLLCCQNTLLASTRADSSWGGLGGVKGDLFVWSDNENSWVKKNIGKAAASTLLLRPVGPYVVAYAWSPGQYKDMFLSSDGGKTFQQLGWISTSEDPLSYSFTNEELFVGSNLGVWRHTITNPVSYHTRSAQPHIVNHHRPNPAFTCTVSGRTLRFKIATGFEGTPRLSLISVNGRKIADLHPAIIDKCPLRLVVGRIAVQSSSQSLAILNSNPAFFLGGHFAMRCPLCSMPG